MTSTRETMPWVTDTCQWEQDRGSSGHVHELATAGDGKRLLAARPPAHLLSADGEANHGHAVPYCRQLGKRGKRGILPERIVVNCQQSQVAVAAHSHHPGWKAAVVGAPLHLDLQWKGSSRGERVRYMAKSRIICTCLVAGHGCGGQEGTRRMGQGLHAKRRHLRGIPA